MKEQFYLYWMADYSVPSFVSNIKPYFGSKRDFLNVINSMDTGELDDLRVAYIRLVKGDIKAEYYAGQIKTRFAYRAKILAERQIEMPCVSYDFENTYGFHYYVRAESLCGYMRLVEQGGKYFVIYNVAVQCVEYSCEFGVQGKWDRLDGCFFGHPGILKYSDKKIITNLWLPDSQYDERDAAFERFNQLTSLNLHGFCEDIFGDG